MSLFWSVLSQVSLYVKLDAACLIGNLFSRKSLSDESFSILGSTGPDECFNDEYAELYRAGRVRSIPDVYLEPIADCHREFLRSLHVKANMVAPILVGTRLWGLLVAHHCESSKNWSDLEVQAMLNSAKSLAKVPAIALS